MKFFPLKKRTCLLLFLPIATLLPAAPPDSARLPVSRIISYCLDGDVKTAMPLLATMPGEKVSAQDSAFRTKMELRFLYDEDRSGYTSEHHSKIDPLLKIFRDYWRASLLDPSHSYDSTLRAGLSSFFAVNFRLENTMLPDDTLDKYLGAYVENAGYHTTGFGQTGRLLDLLVWKEQQDTTYVFRVFQETIRTQVVFMTGFITLGWEEYATLGRAYPGGWATATALYCVKESYDLGSENFHISYLCHEGRHFADYAQFPKLQGADLEYRAKLTELSLLDKDLYKVLGFFIENANYDSDNAHSVANYCVVRDLSRKLFKTDFEKDLTKWKAAGPKKIHKASHALLEENTRQLQAQGKDVEKWIRK